MIKKAGLLFSNMVLENEISPEANYFLGFMHEHGYGVSKDIIICINYY
jgi:TPR repeat protein